VILVSADLLALRRLHDLDHQHLDMEHLLLQVGATLEPLPCLSRSWNEIYPDPALTVAAIDPKPSTSTAPTAMSKLRSVKTASSAADSDRSSQSSSAGHRNCVARGPDRAPSPR